MKHEPACPCDDCNPERVRLVRPPPSVDRDELRSALLWRYGLYLFAHNITVGAALCTAFDDGWEQHELFQCYHKHEYRLQSRWRPGRNLPFPEPEGAL